MRKTIHIYHSATCIVIPSYSIEITKNSTKINSNLHICPISNHHKRRFLLKKTLYLQKLVRAGERKMLEGGREMLSTFPSMLFRLHPFFNKQQEIQTRTKTRESFNIIFKGVDDLQARPNGRFCDHYGRHCRCVFVQVPVTLKCHGWPFR